MSRENRRHPVKIRRIFAGCLRIAVGSIGLIGGARPAAISGSRSGPLIAKITGCRGFPSNIVCVNNFVKPKLFKAAQPPAIQ